MLRERLVRRRAGEEEGALVGLASVAIAAIGGQEAVDWAGLIYLLIFPLQVMNGRFMDSRRRRSKANHAGTAREEEGGP